MPISVVRTAAVLCGLLLTTAVVGCQQENNSAATTAAQMDSLRTVNETLQREIASLEASIAASPASDPEPEGVTLDPPVYFPSGSAWLTDRGRETLDAHAERIKGRYENRDFRIKGYTDSRPIGPSLKDTYPSNWYLSAQRAAAVAHYLDTEHQIRTQTLEIGAYGPQVPVASNETPEGRQRNRRVEIVIDRPSTLD